MVKAGPEGAAGREYSPVAGGPGWEGLQGLKASANHLRAAFEAGSADAGGGHAEQVKALCVCAAHATPHVGAAHRRLKSGAEWGERRAGLQVK